MTTGDRTVGLTGAVLDLDDAEASVGLDLAAAVRAGARAVRFTGPVHLTADEPRATLAVVRLLREAAADGLPVTWHARISDEIDPRLLVHLAPPESLAGASVSEWRRRHRPGLCYYRLGPDFVFVKDVRRPDASNRFRLDNVVNAFRTLEDVVDVAGLEPSTRRLLDDLDEEDLVLRLDRLATLLPNRIRRWPVPALEL